METLKRSIQLALVMTLLLAACGQAVTPLPVPTSTPSQTPTRTLTPTSIPVLNDTPTITPFPPVIRTTTPQPLPPSHYDLPAWMADPQIEILASPTIQGDWSISFFNTATFERYDIRLPSMAHKYFWFDDTHFGLLSNDLKTMYLMDLDSGDVATQSVSPETMRFLEKDNSYKALWVKHDPSTSTGYAFDDVQPAVMDNRSKDNLYSYSRDTSGEESILVITDLINGQEVWRSNQPAGYSIHWVTWSPVQASVIAFVEGKRNPWLSPDINTTLIVMDVRTEEIISSHSGDIGGFAWSPDGTRILYENSISTRWNFGFGFTVAPCIFDLRSGDTSCIWNIPNRKAPDGYILETTAGYEWSRDGISLYYSYQYIGTVHYELHGDLCIYHLLDGSIQCPTDAMTDLPGWDAAWVDTWAHFGWVVWAMDFSPSGQVIHICNTIDSMLSDSQGGPSLEGLIDINGTRMISWAGILELGGKNPVPGCLHGSGLWRPLPGEP